MISVGTTPAVVDVPANVPAPGLPARSKVENQQAATAVRDAVFINDRYCLALARNPSNDVIAIEDYAAGPVRVNAVTVTGWPAVMVTLTKAISPSAAVVF